MPMVRSFVLACVLAAACSRPTQVVENPGGAPGGSASANSGAARSLAESSISSAVIGQTMPIAGSSKRMPGSWGWE